MINTTVILHVGCPPEDANNNILDSYDVLAGETIDQLLYASITIPGVTWAKLSMHLYVDISDDLDDPGTLRVDKEIIVGYFRFINDKWEVSAK